MSRVPPALCVTREGFAELRAALPAVTEEHLQDVLGISKETWRKMRQGRPIRATTFERLMAKYRRGRGRALERDPA